MTLFTVCSFIRNALLRCDEEPIVRIWGRIQSGGGYGSRVLQRRVKKRTIQSIRIRQRELEKVTDRHAEENDRENDKRGLYSHGGATRALYTIIILFSNYGVRIWKSNNCTDMVTQLFEGEIRVLSATAVETSRNLLGNLWSRYSQE